jgi:nitroreductase
VKVPQSDDPALAAVLSRRSVRRYTDDEVSDEAVELLLRAAMNAPSAGNEQPWQFVVIRDRAVLARVPESHLYASMVPSASLAVLVCGDLHLEAHRGYWIQDCSAATMSLLLAAHALGLGAVWLGVYPTEDRVAGLRRLLALPDHIVPLALVPVGFPADPPLQVDRFDPTRIHEDRW